MADDRYGGYGRREGWRERGSSIFSDDDDRSDRGSSRWSSEHGRGRGGRDDERGFFERAGDEVRSWFGDDEAERRRERDVRRDEARGAFAGRDEDRFGESRGGGRETGGYGFSSQSGSSQSGDDWEQGRRERLGWGSGFDRGSGSSFGSGSRGEQGSGWQGRLGGRSQWDDHYRSWRDQQIAQFDREYDDFCRERQQQFEQDFDSWRNSRLTQGGSTEQTGAGSSSGFAGGTGREQGRTGGTSRSMGSESAGATSGGGGTGSAIGSSTGSTGAAAETGSKVGAGETGGGGRGRGTRSRT